MVGVVIHILYYLSSTCIFLYHNHKYYGSEVNINFLIMIVIIISSVTCLQYYQLSIEMFFLNYNIVLLYIGNV